ncbi:hypothetical protein Leryth_011496 [Lithospermum erythrorhizon]|nr:hypothetical protein Leryth_011496 [Lithospermum erythrorhizon]
MALTNHRILFNIPTKAPPLHHHPLLRSFTIPTTPHVRTTTIVSASRKSGSSRTGRFDSKNRRTSVPTKDEEEEDMGGISGVETGSFDALESVVKVSDDGVAMPDLPGLEPDFWEGPQWEPLGFFIQYMWAFGILFALVSGGIAVATYNEGAADFKDTPVYKEAIQSGVLEEPEGSNSEVFESNPTEQTPNVE